VSIENAAPSAGVTGNPAHAVASHNLRLTGVHHRNTREHGVGEIADDATHRFATINAGVYCSRVAYNGVCCRRAHQSPDVYVTRDLGGCLTALNDTARQPHEAANVALPSNDGGGSTIFNHSALSNVAHKAANVGHSCDAWVARGGIG
jgi:hypothetical protein